MHIDPFTIVIFNIFISLLTSAALFSISQGYLNDMKGILQWATALLCQSISLILLALMPFIPKFLSIDAGVTVYFLGLIFYTQGIVAFKKQALLIRKLYLIAVMGLIGNIYFIHIHLNMAAKMAVTSVTIATLLAVSSFLLLSHQPGKLPASHRFTGSVFALAAVVSLARGGYYLFWHHQVSHHPFDTNIMQSLFFLTHTFLLIGTSFGFVLMCNEKYVSQKNHAQFEQRQTLDRLQKIANQVPGVVYQFKMAKEGHFSVPYCSNGVINTFRLSPEQVCRDVESIFNRVHPQDYARFLAAIHQSAQDLSLWLCTFRVQFEDGDVRWLEGNALPESQADGSILWHGFISDVSERKQVEMELHTAKETAITANQAKSEFLANMSHEIRTPMNAILGFSSILNEVITDPKHRYYLNAIERSGKTLLQLINDILDLSKIEAGKLALQYVPVSISSLLDDIQLIFSQTVREKNLDFCLLIGENLPDKVCLDEIRLRQVLINLVGNAVKFTASGFIHVSVSVETTAVEQLLDLSITIADSGIGISPDQQESIFLPFIQQRQQSLSYGGTGLGLPICRRLIEMMGGTISVTSRVGQGSCFTIKLANVRICTLAHHPHHEQLPSKPLRFRPARVLIVDDSEINRQVLTVYLDDYPELELIEAENGEQALDFIMHYDFALILMDRVMPGESGDSVCEKIRALPTYATIPIIMITASVLKLSPAFEIFYDIELNKPVNKNELLTALQIFLPLDDSTLKHLNFNNLQTLSAYQEPQTAENWSSLIAVLTPYRDSIKQMCDADGFDISALIDIAEQLLQIASLHQCSLLSEWAANLKKQAQLFDVVYLAKTLTDFERLIQTLKQHIEV